MLDKEKAMLLKTERARALAAQYLGCQPNEFTTVAVFPDPFVPGVYAIRAVLCETEVHDFFVTGSSRNGKINWHDIKEVEFYSWPPTSERPRFCRR